MIKKVVILHPAHWEQAMGGAELQISYLVTELKKQGFEVHFIFENKGKHIENKLRIHLHPLKKINLRKWFGQRWLLYRKRINWQLKEINPDVIYTRMYSSWSGFAANYAKKNNIQHIWAIASDNDLKQYKKKNNLLKPLDYVENYHAFKSYKNATHILTQNDFQQKQLKKLHNRDGLKVHQMTPGVNKNELIKKEKIEILWIANLKPIKKPEQFIELASKFKNNKSLCFTMIGRENQKYSNAISLAQRNQNNFRYLGEISNDKVNKMLSGAHILISTSEAEGFSNTFVQAWMRKVIVLSMNSNPDEIITNEKIGYLCPTVKELQSKIEFLINHPRILSEMGGKAYHYAIQNHSVEKNMEKVISLIR